LQLATRAWRQKGDDSLAAIINTRADTVNLLSTKAWRQKGVDSLNARIALRLNISDTATMLSPYVRAAGFGLTKSGQSLLVDSASMATRARVQKGIDSVASVRVGGSGTTNYVPKFTASSTLGNSKLFDNGTQLFYNQTTQVYRRVTALEFDQGALWVKSNGMVGLIGLMGLRDSTAADVGGRIQFHAVVNNSNGDQTEIARIFGARENATELNGAAYITFGTKTSNVAGDPIEAMRITSSQETLFGTTTDNGAYRVQISGGLLNTGNAVFNSSSGESYFGTTTDFGDYRAQISGSLYASGNSYIAGTTFASINNNEKFNVGSTTNRSVWYNGTTFNSQMQIEKAGTAATNYLKLALIHNSADNEASYIGFAKSRSNTLGSTTIVQDGDILGSLTFQGADGTNYVEAAGIGVAVSGTPKSDTIPTQISFSTMNITSGFTTKMRIRPDGELWVGYSSDQGAYILQANGNGIFNGSLTTSAPNGGTAASWKLGSRVASSVTLNGTQYIELDIGGTLYYLATVSFLEPKPTPKP
jgi:hypothetical protein